MVSNVGSNECLPIAQVQTKTHLETSWPIPAYPRRKRLAVLTEALASSEKPDSPGVAKHTVLKLLKDRGCAAASYHNKHIRNLRLRRVQADEIWAFVYGKDKNLTLEQVQAGAGSVWTWTAIDADTKLIISYTLGDRGAETAKVFMHDVASRISNRIQLTTDGHRIYAEAVEQAFGWILIMRCWSKYTVHQAKIQNRAIALRRVLAVGQAFLAGDPDPRYQHVICRTK